MARRWDPTAQTYVDDTAPGSPPPLSAVPPALGFNEMGGADPTFDALMAQLQSGRAQAESDYTAGTNALNTQYQPQYDELANQKNRADQNLAAQMANNGMYRSGNYLQGAGDLGEMYQKQVGGVQGEQNAQMQQLLAARLNRMNEYGGQEAAGQAAHAGVLGEYAKERARRESETASANEAAAAEAARNQQEQAGMVPNATGQYEAPQPWSQPVYSQNPNENTMQDWFNEMQRYQDNPLMMNSALNSYNNGWGQNAGLQSYQQDPRMLEIKRRLGIPTQ